MTWQRGWSFWKEPSQTAKPPPTPTEFIRDTPCTRVSFLKPPYLFSAQYWHHVLFFISIEFIFQRLQWAPMTRPTRGPPLWGPAPCPWAGPTPSDPSLRRSEQLLSRDLSFRTLVIFVCYFLRQMSSSFHSVEGIINIDLYRGFNVSLDKDEQVSLPEIRYWKNKTKYFGLRLLC